MRAPTAKVDLQWLQSPDRRRGEAEADMSVIADVEFDNEETIRAIEVDRKW
jgi:hypothetical protein